MYIVHITVLKSAKRAKIYATYCRERHRAPGVPTSFLRLHPTRVQTANDYKRRYLAIQCIGVGAQSTLGGGRGDTTCRKICMKKNNKIPKFYMILARKISRIP